VFPGGDDPDRPDPEQPGPDEPGPNQSGPDQSGIEASIEQFGIDEPGPDPFGLGESGIGALLAQAQQMQQQLLAAQDELSRTEVTGTSGGGLVTATITGGGELTGLVIDPTAIDPEDPDGLADLVVAAVRDAHRVAAELQQQAMGPLAGVLGGGGLSLPGM
jgi:DNA-binding YbaB/EbfC family protein